LRPILMTSGTTILGLVPLALGIGEGSELQAPLALTVLGGLTSSMFLTLVFIPAIYVLVENQLSAIPFFRKTDRLAQGAGSTEKTEHLQGIEQTLISPAPQTTVAADNSAAEIAGIRRELEAKEAAIEKLQQLIKKQQTEMALQSLDKDKQLETLKKQLQEKEAAMATLKRDIYTMQEQAKTAAQPEGISVDREKELQEKLRQYAQEENRLKDACGTT